MNLGKTYTSSELESLLDAKCSTNTDCVVKKVDSKITEELIASILTKASEFENQSKKKKK